jgi:tRNA(Ser,Leu) C12 N-acetylase TAN1
MIDGLRTLRDKEDEMNTYEHYRRGAAEIGAIVLRLYNTEGQVRGYIREVKEGGEDTTFPSEELEVDNALRLAENKNLDHPDMPIYVEMAEGVRWDPAWGKLN